MSQLKQNTDNPEHFDLVGLTKDELELIQVGLTEMTAKLNSNAEFTADRIRCMALYEDIDAELTKQIVES